MHKPQKEVKNIYISDNQTNLATCSIINYFDLNQTKIEAEKHLKKYFKKLA